MHSWIIFGAWTSHMHTQIYKTHHGLDLKEATTFPLIIFFVISHGGYTQMLFCPKIETPNTLEAHNFLCKPLMAVKFEAKL